MTENQTSSADWIIYDTNPWTWMHQQGPHACNSPFLFILDQEFGYYTQIYGPGGWLSLLFSLMHKNQEFFFLFSSFLSSLPLIIARIKSI